MAIAVSKQVNECSPAVETIINVTSKGIVIMGTIVLTEVHHNQGPRFVLYANNII